jgi:GAF domain-containing protein
MLLGEGGVLRYVAASDEPGQMLEALHEHTGEGPCIDAFLDDQPVVTADMAADPRWPSIGPLAADHGIRAVLGVPIDLREGPVGTLNVYATKPYHFGEDHLDAIRAYTRVIASLLRAAVRAHVEGRAATQLQHALDHRVVIEQAKGVVMERRKLDEKAAFELLRTHARSARMPLDEVARQVLRGERLTR